MRIKILEFNRANLVLMAILVIGFGVIAGRAFYVQIINAEFYTAEGSKRQVRTLVDPAPRGQIFDRHGELLALSTPVATISINPKLLNRYPEAITKLAKSLDMSEPDLVARIEANSTKQYMYLKRSIVPSLAEKVEDLALPGVYVEPEYKRFYPAGETTAHLLGYTNIDDQGQDGIERVYNHWLKGEAGSKQIIKDQAGRVIKFVQNIKQAKPGNNIELTIDKEIQYFAQKAIKSAMKKHDAKAASMVILDAKTGAILALVNEPTFNPNNRATIKGESIRNRGLKSLIEPGSTIKPLVVAKALDAGVISPHEVIPTSPGVIRIQKARISDVKNYQDLTVGEVLQKSSNVAMVKISQKLSAEQQWQLFDDLGFGQQMDGFFISAATGNLKHFSSWMEIDQAVTSFGYGFNITLLQLAHSYLPFANQGKLPPLAIFKSEENSAAAKAKQIFSAKSADQVKAMLEAVTLPGGTGTKAQIDGYRVAGKTGTVHKASTGGYQENNYVATFVGMVPASNPDMVAAVFLDQPSRGEYSGGAVAAPIFQEAMQHALRLRNIDPDWRVE